MIKSLVVKFVKAYITDELRDYTVRETFKALFDELDMVKQYNIVTRYYNNIKDESKDRDSQIDELLDDYSKAIWDTLTRYEVAELLTGTDEQIIDYFFLSVIKNIACISLYNILL